MLPTHLFECPMIIEHAFIIAMTILFIHACSWKGMIFEGVKKLIKPEGHLYKPIYGCPICMTPYYGSIMYLLFFRLSFIDWLLTIGTAAGLSVVSVLFIDIKDSLCKRYDHHAAEQPDAPTFNR